CVLCICLVGVISYRITKKLNTDLVMINLQTLTDSTYNLIESAVNSSIRNHLRAIAEQNKNTMEMFYSRVESGDISLDEARTEIEKIFLSQVVGTTGYTYVIDSNGILKIHPLMKGSDISEYAFIKEQIARKDGYMEYSWKNPTDSEPRDKALYMTYFDKWDAIISVTEGTSIYDSVDSQGNHFIQEIIKRKNGTIVYPWKNPGEPAAREKIVIYKHFEPLDYYLCSGVYIDELVAPIERMKFRLALTALCILIFAVCISLWYSKILLRPIHNLINATEKVIDGQYDVQITTERGDEIGRLTLIFSKMLAQIRRYLADLHSTNAELETVNITLEKKVEERTRQLEALSNQDGLTGIANRRKLDEYLKHEYDLAARNNFALSLIILDIDCFKRYNDTYGHPAGDDCLKKVARTLSDSLHRSSDFVARYGGEEFMAILSNASHKSACEIAERIRINVERLAIPHEASPVSATVTISLGVCTLIDCTSTSLDDFISRADEALYRAKENGRNRIEALCS
ncbi:diguanylate cyclase, partial [bacterium]|nr:diguanylate cyclase [bacterium]